MATLAMLTAPMATNGIFQSKILTGAGLPPEYRSRRTLPVVLELEHYSMAYSRSRRTLMDVRSTPGGTDGLRCLIFESMQQRQMWLSRQFRECMVHKPLYTACEGSCRTGERLPDHSSATEVL